MVELNELIQRVDHLITQVEKIKSTLKEELQK